MKRIFTLISIAAVACACNKTNPVVEANINEGYGFIDMNVSSDDAVAVKAVQNVTDFSTWTIKIGDTAYTGTDQKFAAGDYTASASNYVDEAAALSAEGGWGDAFYKGTKAVTVVAGQTVTAAIECGKAQNARLAVAFNTDSFGTVITDYSVTVAKDGVSGGLTFNAENVGAKKAYFAAAASTTYSINYKYNGADKSITGKSVTLGAAATEKTIRVAANQNGTITVTISYDDEFTGAGEEESIVIDAATGAEATE